MTTTRTIGGRTYVVVDGTAVAIMERSPFTGEYGYGVRVDLPERTGKSIGPNFYYRPPFTPTRRKTAKAAAAVVVSQITSKS